MGLPDHCPWLPSTSRRISPRLLRGCRHRRAAFRTSRSHWTFHLSTPPEPPRSPPLNLRGAATAPRSLRTRPRPPPPRTQTPNALAEGVANLQPSDRQLEIS